MACRIEWSKYSGEDIERAIATYICSDYPNAVSWRPSRGDHGIDLYRSLDDGTVVVYQIKKFTSSLTASQKRQIENSWVTMLNYISETGLSVSSWYLVMPLDPTPENDAWFRNLTQEYDIEAHWWGLSHIEGWASKYPNVSDYYFNDCKQSTLSAVDNALAAARVPNVKNDEDMQAQLAAIFEEFQRKDPHYAYDVYLLGRSIDCIGNANIPPGVLVSSMVELQSGGIIRIDVRAKHSLATKLAPLSFNVSFRAESEAQKKAIKNHIEYGEQFENMPVRIDNVSKEIPLAGVGFGETTNISLLGKGKKADLKAILVNSLGREIPLVPKNWRKGQKGFIFDASDEYGMLILTVRYSTEDSMTSIRGSFQFESLSDAPLRQVKRIISFFLDDPAGSFALNLNGLKLFESNLNKFGFPKDGLEELWGLTGMLETISNYSDDEVLFPDIFSLTERDKESIEVAAEILENGMRVSLWHKLRLDKSDYNEALAGQLLLFRHVGLLQVKIGESDYKCGFVESFGVGSLINDEQGSVLFAAEEYGNKLITHYVKRSEEIVSSKGDISAIAAPPVKTWNVLATTPEGLQKLSSMFSKG